MKPLTFEECCDQVAKKWGLPDMKSFVSQGRPYFGNQDRFFEQCAELYASSKDARIAELEADVKLWINRFNTATEQRDYYFNKIGEQEAEIKRLREEIIIQSSQQK